jgi:hypothetical protein
MDNSISHVYTVQQGSSGTLRVTDESAWYLVRETWQGARLLDARIVSKHETRAEALDARYLETGENNDAVYTIGVTLFTGNLAADGADIDLDASAQRLAEKVEHALSGAYPDADIAVVVDRAVGVAPATRVNGKTDHPECDEVDAIVTRCWSAFDWLVKARPDA